MVTALFGLFVCNAATAVLMAPVAPSIAERLGASPYPFAMIVALAASVAFVMLISSPVNTLVLGPGHYRFGDSARVGVPFTLLVMAVSVAMVLWLFPFQRCEGARAAPHDTARATRLVGQCPAAPTDNPPCRTSPPPPSPCCIRATATRVATTSPR